MNQTKTSSLKGLPLFYDIRVATDSYHWRYLWITSNFMSKLDKLLLLNKMFEDKKPLNFT